MEQPKDCKQGAVLVLEKHQRWLPRPAPFEN